MVLDEKKKQGGSFLLPRQPDDFSLRGYCWLLCSEVYTTMAWRKTSLVVVTITLHFTDLSTIAGTLFFYISFFYKELILKNFCFGKHMSFRVFWENRARKQSRFDLRKMKSSL